MVVSVRMFIIVYLCMLLRFLVDISLVCFIRVSNIGNWKQRLKVMISFSVMLSVLLILFWKIIVMLLFLMGVLIGVFLMKKVEIKEDVFVKFKKNCIVRGVMMKWVKVVLEMNSMGEVIKNGKNVDFLL